MLGQKHDLMAKRVSPSESADWKEATTCFASSHEGFLFKNLLKIPARKVYS